jgi:amidase
MSVSDVDERFAASGAFIERFTLDPKGSGPLNGLSFAIKDVIDVEGRITTCGNPSWRDSHSPAAANAVCVDQLLYAGAHAVGKTVTDELAFGLTGENFFFGTPLNPKAPDRVPGGSSCGSASAVACGLVDFALGTDTGGSVRVPANNCGIFGMRPTLGIASVAGVNPLAPSYDTVGVFAASCDVLSRAASVLLNCEVPTSADVGTVSFLREPFEAADQEVNEALQPALEIIRELFPGQTTTTGSLEAIADGLCPKGLRSWYELYSWIQWAEVWSCLGPWVKETSPSFGPRTQVSFELVRQIERERSMETFRLREKLYRNIRRFLGPNDLICIPTAPALPPLKGSLGLDRSAEGYYPRTLSLTAIAGVGRLPQISLPLADCRGIPVGLSLIAAQGMDGFLLAVAERVASRASKRGAGKSSS